jgi:hypothetical protein
MNWLRASVFTVMVALSTIAAWSCSSAHPNDVFAPEGHDAAGSSSGSVGGDDATSGPPEDGPVWGGFGDGGIVPKEASTGTGCKNLQCQIHDCGEAGGKTTVTGQVFDPAGRNPLYNVVVYVPNSANGALDAIPIGIGANSCSCSALFSGEPIVDTSTDTSGKFTLSGVPDGANIPLVVQIGKWRKEIVIPSVKACQANDAGKITLPKNLKDGAYASMPNIAVSTGGLDTLECLLTRVGVDGSVFTGSPSGPGVHVFQGSGGNAATGSQSSPASLWDSTADLSRFDIVMLSCEGSPTAGVSATTAGALGPYVDQGGRVFAEHYHYAFFTSYAKSPGTAFPQFANVANWDTVGLAANDNYGSDITGVIQTTLPNGKAFPEGAALKTWLGNVGALNAAGEIVVPSINARQNAIVQTGNLGTPWVQTDPSVTPKSSQYFSWDMPLSPKIDDAGVPQYCGRVVYSDMHVSGSAADYQGGNSTVPTGCDATSALSADEDAIEFILFDLSSCLTPVGFTPQPPPAEAGGPAQ